MSALQRFGRRETLGAALGALGALGPGCSKRAPEVAPVDPNPSDTGALVYCELQVTAPFATASWRAFGSGIQAQPGFLSTTWLSGVATGSLGSLTLFDSLDHAEIFTQGFLPAEAEKLRAAQTIRIFELRITAEASTEMGSPYHGGKLGRAPGAFVYTEVVQLPLVPFAERPWRETNRLLKKQPGLLAKTWLAGLGVHTTGGFYAFDSIENAELFAVSTFPSKVSRLESAFATRIFDARVAADASRALRSPFYG